MDLSGLTAVIVRKLRFHSVSQREAPICARRITVNATGRQPAGLSPSIRVHRTWDCAASFAVATWGQTMGWRGRARGRGSGDLNLPTLRRHLDTGPRVAIEMRHDAALQIRHGARQNHKESGRERESSDHEANRGDPAPAH